MSDYVSGLLRKPLLLLHHVADGQPIHYGDWYSSSTATYDAPDVPDVSEEERPVADAIPPEPEENQEPDQSQSNEEATD